MKAFKWMPVVAAVSLALTGCGSSSKSGGGPGPGPTPPPSTTYTWQMVYLKSEVKSSVPSSCAVYATDTSVNGNVIVAYRGNENSNILIHNADGSVKEKRHPNTLGKITISENDIPSNGFVSVEELDGTIGNEQDVYLFSVQKALMSDLTINVRRTSAASTSCYTTGESFTEVDVNSDAVINIGQVSTSTEYYQTSYIDAATSGKQVGTGVGVKSELPAQDKVLVTLFDSYNGLSGQKKELTHYQLADKSMVYDVNGSSSQSVNPTNQGVIRPGLTINGVTLDNNNANRIDVAYASEVYEWQPIYQTSANYSYVTDQAPFSSWSFFLNGEVDVSNWKYHAMLPAKGNALNIVAPSLTAFNSTVESSCASGSDFCLSSSGFTASDFDVQRTHLRANTTNSSRVFYQTIYSAPSAEVPLMKSSTETLLPDSNNNRMEVSLAKLTASENAVKYFMGKSIDVQLLTGNSTRNYFDVNGPVTQKTSAINRYIALMGESLTVVSAGKN